MKYLISFFCVFIFHNFNSQDNIDLKIIDSCNLYINNGYQVKALKILTKLEKTFTQKKNFNTQFKTYRLIGKAMYDIGDRINAVKYYDLGLQLAKKTEDSLSIADFYVSLASINFHGIGNLSLQQLNIAENIYKNLKNKQRLSFVKYKKGTYYSFEGNQDSTNYFYNQIIKEFEMSGNDSLLVSIYMNIGVNYGNKNDFENSKLYTLKSISLSKKINDLRNLSLGYANYAGYFTEDKKYDSCIYYSNLAIKVATIINYIRPKIVAYENMLDFYKKKKEYKFAFLTLERYKVLSDSFRNADKDIASLTLQMNSEFKEKENQAKIDNLIKEKEASEKMFKQRMIIIAVSLIMLIFIIAAFILYNRFKVIQKQKNIIDNQKEVLENKNEIIEEKQKEIIDSINYAKRIQFSLLAHTDLLNENIPNHFVYFNPKDIVSGDFYWATRNEDKFYLAVCDSTGHGVPGAFMSLLSIGFLNEAIKEKGIEKPNEVFNFVRQRLIDNISKEGQKDGFDGILICLDLKTKQLTYSAANNKPLLISNEAITELVADRMPVGMGERKEDFKLYTAEVKEGDVIYLYTDGYADQFGGPKGKKFKYKPLNEIILENHKKPLSIQQDILKTTFDSWRGDLEQVDDVCVIGIKF